MSDTPFVSPFTRLDAPDSNTTERPDPAVRAAALFPLLCLPRDDTLARVLTGAATALAAVAATSTTVTATTATVRARGWVYGLMRLPLCGGSALLPGTDRGW